MISLPTSTATKPGEQPRPQGCGFALHEKAATTPAQFAWELSTLEEGWRSLMHVSFVAS